MREVRLAHLAVFSGVPKNSPLAQTILLAALKEALMSLTAHINNTGSLIGQYLWQRYHSSAPLARAANRQLIGATTIRPDVTGYPWAMVSRAVDYRLRYAFGLTRRQLAMPAYGAQILAEQHAEHYQSSLWQAFFDQLDMTIANLQPAGRRLDREG